MGSWSKRRGHLVLRLGVLMPVGSDTHAPGETSRLVGVWLLSRIPIVIATLIGSWAAFRVGNPLDVFGNAWHQWDTLWYESIATGGYQVPNLGFFDGEDPLDFQFNIAFFPALPLLMKAGAIFGLTASWSGILVSLVAGGFACVALGRLVFDVGGRPTVGVWVWTLAPTAVFLAAPYTEALFAAFAFWAWWCARRHAWVWAGVLAGCAAAVRSNALFLGVALIAMLLITDRSNWRRGLALVLPFVVTLGYFWFLAGLTGSWTAWFDVQRVRWDRHTVDPITSFLNTYEQVFTFNGPGTVSSRFISELLAGAILVALTLIIVGKRWWAESIYVGLTLIALMTSTWYYSIPRTAVLLFPIWMLLGLWASRYRWFFVTYLTVSVPFLVLVTVRYTQGQWIS